MKDKTLDNLTRIIDNVMKLIGLNRESIESLDKRIKVLETYHMKKPVE